MSGTGRQARQAMHNLCSSLKEGLVNVQVGLTRWCPMVTGGYGRRQCGGVACIVAASPHRLTDPTAHRQGKPTGLERPAGRLMRKGWV